MLERKLPKEPHVRNACNEYFKLFKGQTVSMNKIKKEHPIGYASVVRKVEQGHVIGQHTLEGDIVLWVREEK